MGDMSIFHWLLTGTLVGIVLLAVLIVPALLFSRVLARAGFPAWWALIGLVPVINLIFLWVFAFVPWPVEQGRSFDGKRLP
jgi:hypothetical protein